MRRELTRRLRNSPTPIPIWSLTRQFSGPARRAGLVSGPGCRTIPQCPLTRRCRWTACRPSLIVPGWPPRRRALARRLPPLRLLSRRVPPPRLSVCRVPLLRLSVRQVPLRRVPGRRVPFLRLRVPLLRAPLLRPGRGRPGPSRLVRRCRATRAGRDPDRRPDRNRDRARARKRGRPLGRSRGRRRDPERGRRPDRRLALLWVDQHRAARLRADQHRADQHRADQHRAARLRPGPPPPGQRQFRRHHRGRPARRLAAAQPWSAIRGDRRSDARQPCSAALAAL